MKKNLSVSANLTFDNLLSQQHGRVLKLEAHEAKEPKRTTHFLFNYHLAATCLLSSIHQKTLLSKGNCNQTPIVPIISFQTVVYNPQPEDHVTLGTNRITHKIPMFLFSPLLKNDCQGLMPFNTVIYPTHIFVGLSASARCTVTLQGQFMYGDLSVDNGSIDTLQKQLKVFLRGKINILNLSSYKVYLVSCH